MSQQKIEIEDTSDEDVDIEIEEATEEEIDIEIEESTEDEPNIEIEDDEEYSEYDSYEKLSLYLQHYIPHIELCLLQFPQTCLKSIQSLGYYSDLKHCKETLHFQILNDTCHNHPCRKKPQFVANNQCLY